MKKILMLGLMVAAISGCSTAQKNETEKPTLGMANPASTYCVEQGGKLEIRKEANGEVGYCHLPNGQIIEEWALFRASQSKCVAEQATALIGQSNLTEAQIKQKNQCEDGTLSTTRTACDYGLSRRPCDSNSRSENQ